MKNLFIDVETTGINPWEHSIIQIAALLEVDGIIQDKIILDVAPILGSKVDQEALNITGKTLEIIQNYPSAENQLSIFIEFLKKHIDQYNKQDKMFFVAYNAPFDYEFIRAFFIRQNQKYFGSFFWNPALDVMTLALQHLQKDRLNMPNFKLSTVASMFDLETNEKQLHDAYYDIDITYKVYRKIYPLKRLEKDISDIQEKIIESPVFKDTLF